MKKAEASRAYSGSALRRRARLTCLRIACSLSCHSGENCESHEQLRSVLPKEHAIEATRPLFIPVILGTARMGRMSLHAARGKRAESRPNSSTLQGSRY
jgi:hypothetical protein